MQEVDFLDYIVKNIVTNPDDVKIEKKDDELWTLLTLSVNKEDMWIVIWKWWNTVSSLRSLLKILWMKLDKRINLKVLD